MVDLQNYRNCHQGKTIVVCGCGESLLTLPQSDDLITIGVNDVARLFDPTYLVVLNPQNQFKGDRYQYVQQAKVSAIFSQLLVESQHSPVVRFQLGIKGGTNCFNSDQLHYTRNSPYLAVCLAAYMGASKICLIGVDFTTNHFFAKTGHHSLSRGLNNIDKEYGKLYQALRQVGVSLVNLSALSRLSSIPKQSMADFCAKEAVATTNTSQVPTQRGSTQTSAPEQKSLKILHIAQTNCAGALWNLHHLLEQDSSVRSRVVTASQYTSGRCYPKDVLLSETTAVAQLIAWADVLYFHNRLDKDSPQMRVFRHLLQKKPALLQFHSGPDDLQRNFPSRDLVSRSDIKTLVIAQKQARFYPNAQRVPNAIDIYQADLQPQITKSNARLTVLYTPTDTRSYADHTHTCSGKGYAQTVDILQKLDKAGLINAQIHTNISWDEVMRLRRHADVVIDECVTGGYHLTSLEALSQGLVTIAWLDKLTVQLLAQISGSPHADLPWVNSPINQLERQLTELAADPVQVAAIKRQSRLWMEKYWSPNKVCQHYVRACRELMVAQTTLRATRSSQIPVGYQLAGKPHPKRSEDFAQTIRLNAPLLQQSGAYAGQACHILGSGPSVTDFDLMQLKNRVVITVNASSTLEPQLSRPADFYCVSDRRFLTDAHTRKMAQLSNNSIRVFAGYCHGYLPDAEINYVRILNGDGISTNVETGFYHNCSVVLFAAQLALSLGCYDIYLHGCEFDYAGGRFCKNYNHAHDRDTYSRIAKNVKALAKIAFNKGGSLNIVGPSRLVGDFGFEAVDLVNKISTQDLSRAIHQHDSKKLIAADPQSIYQLT